MKTILSIIGIIALIWLTALLIAHIIEYIVFKHSEDSNWCSITRDTSIYNTECNNWYIIPTFYCYFEFYNKRYPQITFIWLKWVFTISYHFKTELEEEAENEARRKLSEQND